MWGQPTNEAEADDPEDGEPAPPTNPLGNIARARARAAAAFGRDVGASPAAAAAASASFQWPGPPGIPSGSSLPSLKLHQANLRKALHPAPSGHWKPREIHQNQ